MKKICELLQLLLIIFQLSVNVIDIQEDKRSDWPLLPIVGSKIQKMFNLYISKCQKVYEE